MALAKIIKVYWHCLIRAIALKTNHRMSTLIVFANAILIPSFSVFFPFLYNRAATFHC